MPLQVDAGVGKSLLQKVALQLKPKGSRGVGVGTKEYFQVCIDIVFTRV